jgi:hypothetical protein
MYLLLSGWEQGCHKVYFQTKNTHLRKILEGRKLLVYFIAIWSILRPFGIHTLWPFGIFHGYFPPFWYVVPRKIWQPWLGVIQHSS